MMTRQLKGLLYFFVTDIRYSMTIFWSILLGTTVLSLCLAYFLSGMESARIYFSFPSVMYVYCGILGFITVKEAIPFALKMGATRKNLYFSLGIFFLLIAFIKSVASSTLQTVITAFIDVTGMTTFRIMHLAEFINDTWLNRILIDTTVMFTLLATMFLIGLIFYRAGMLGGGIVVAILLVILLLGIAQGWMVDFVVELFSTMDLTLFIQIFGAGLLAYGFSFLFTRKITVIKTK